MTKRRQQQIADRIFNVLSLVLAQNCRDPRLKHIWITAVTVSADLSISKVYFRLKEEPLHNTQSTQSTKAESNTSTDTSHATRVEEALEALRHSHGFFRSWLAQEIRLKRVPHMHFYYDSSPERGEHIMKLISES